MAGCSFPKPRHSIPLGCRDCLSSIWDPGRERSPMVGYHLKVCLGHSQLRAYYLRCITSPYLSSFSKYCRSRNCCRCWASGDIGRPAPLRRVRACRMCFPACQSYPRHFLGFRCLSFDQIGLHWWCWARSTVCFLGCCSKSCSARTNEDERLPTLPSVVIINCNFYNCSLEI